jgi:prepilin-type N-terminal cleavage/methylation domain-containing protein
VMKTARFALHSTAERARSEAGFTLVELLWATMILAVVAGPLVGVLMSSNNAQSQSRERTLAEQAAMAQIEGIRRLPYSSVGTVGGNPGGSVAGTRAITSTGLDARMQTRIGFVNDPTPTSYVTQADYKRVTVVVTRARDGRELTRQVTYVAPPGRGPYAGATDTIVRAQVVDYALSTPVPGATVSIANGPSGSRSDSADASGTVVFPALTANPTSGPQAYYDLAVSATGYQTLRDDVSPAGAAHVQLAPGQTFTTALRVYKPARIEVAINGPTGTPYAGSATVTVTSPRGAQTFAAAGGALSVTQLAGEPIVPSVRYTVSAQTAAGNFAAPVAQTVPPAYPTSLTSTFALTMPATALATVNTTVTVQNAAGTAMRGARVDVTGGPAPVSMTATTDTAGRATFAVPAGGGYTVSASTSAPVLAGSWSGSVATGTAPRVTIR